MLQRFWRPETGIFLAIWLILLAGGQSRFFRDPGTFWHTVVGRQILATHQLGDTDVFSFTFAGQPWSPHQWLGECVLAVLHDRLDGLDTLLLATVTLLAWLYTWAAQRLIRAGLHWSLAAVVLVLAIAASTSHFHIRPHIGTILFLGCTCAFLCDFEAGRIELPRLLWLVPMYLVWTNVHGGMLGGLATLVLALAGWTAYRLLGLESPLTGYRQAFAVAVVILACGLTALVPFGLLLPRIWLGIMDSPILPQIIMEHAPLEPTRIDGILVLLFGAVYLLALLGTLPGWPRVTWLLPLVWFYLACTRIRHAPLFAITALMALADILPRTRWAVRLAQSGSDLFQFPPEKPAPSRRGLDWRPALLPVGAVVAALLLQVSGVRVPLIGHGWATLDPSYWPVALLPRLRAIQHSRPEGTPIFNEYLDGGFLIYHTPGLRVFVDDRCELYGDQWLLQYVQAERGQDTARQIAEWERTYPRFDYALTRSGSAFEAYFHRSDQWQLLEQTPTAALYRRKIASD